VDAADAKAKAKTTKKKKKQTPKPKPQKKRSIKEWGLLQDKDLEAVEDAWMEDEMEDPDDEPFKWQRGPNGERRPPDRRAPKTEMGFVSLTPDFTKERTDKLATQWGDLMHTGGLHVKAYGIEDAKILFVTDEKGYKDMVKVKEFVLRQPVVTEFEWNQQKYTKNDIDKKSPFEFIDEL